MNLEQFHNTFLEECFEALDSMEAALLALDPETPDPESINTVFRVAHSIKGGAGMFGFTAITEFTHVLETLLDLLRSGRLAATPDIADRLLESVDVLRDLLRATQGEQAINTKQVATLRAQLEAATMNPDAVATAATDNTAAAGTVPAADPSATPRWIIAFNPRPELLANGNDPVRLFAELARLGELSVRVRAGKLPVLAELDGEQCLLSWELTLIGKASREDVAAVFEWAEGDCNIEIRRDGDAGPAGASDSQPADPTPAPPSLASPGVLGASTTSKPEAPKSTRSDPGSIRVNIEKIDELLNSVGEIVITQSMLAELGHGMAGAESDRLQSALAQLERNVRELQESVMRVRMLPISSVFSRFPRLVRDLSRKLGKQIDLRLTGEQTELDKTVLEKIGDPLVHLLRNSIDHGIEMPEERAAAGKPRAGTVRLNAFHKGGAIAIELCDDGKGLDRERILHTARERGLVGAGDTPGDDRIFDLIFQPGFSTAPEATELSGRGVGMDVVKRNIRALGGTIDLTSEAGKGTRTSITLPLTLAIVDGLTVAVGNEVYIVPLTAIVESLQLGSGAANRLVGRGEVFSFRGSYLPIIRLHELFDVEPRATELHEGLIMVVEGDGSQAGLFVDDLLGQQQVVVKSMETNYRRIDGISGATILGDGSVALILDVPGIMRVFGARSPVGHAA